MHRALQSDSLRCRETRTLASGSNLKTENTLALHVRAVDVCLDTHPRLVVYTFAPDALTNVWSKRVHSIGVYTNWPFFQIGPADEEKIS